MGNMGAILLDENGFVNNKEAFHIEKRRNTVGAGDSMIAGFIAGCELFHNYEKALQMGMAAAAATVNSLFLATKEEINKFLK